MREKVKFNVKDEVKPLENIEEVSDKDEELSAVEEDNEEQFYATGIYNELRDAIQDTDFKLLLINNDIVTVGTLNGNEIQILDIVGDDENKEFVLKPAPSTLEELLDFKTLYNVSNSKIEIPEGKEVSEAPHEDIVEYILGLKVNDRDTDDVEDDEKEIEELEKEEDEDEGNEQQ